MRLFTRPHFGIVGAMVLLAVPASGALAVSEGYIHEITLHGKPSFHGVGRVGEKIRHARFDFICRSIYDGSELPCEVSFELRQGEGEGAIYDGGHKHGGDGVPRPMTYPADTEPVLQVEGTDFLADESLRAEFITPSAGPVYWTLPEVSGTQEGSAYVELPPGWFCSSLCYTQKIRRYEYTLHIGYEGFESLPEQGDHHTTSRGDDQAADRHPEGQYGTPETIADIKFLAERYYEYREYRLSINDISLPRGGIFGHQENNRWNPPHHMHQWGTDVDINRTDGSGVTRNCHDKEELHEALNDFNDHKEREGRSPAELAPYCWEDPDEDGSSDLAGLIHLYMKGVTHTPWE